MAAHQGVRTVGTDFRWTDYYAMAEPDRPVGAYYTVRFHRPDAGEIDCDFYLHEPAGPASKWAARATAGDPVALWGPRTAYRPPPDTDWWLLGADETGLPATAAILESLPARATARAFIEVPDAGEEQSLREGPGIEVTWLHRGRAEAGTTTQLLDAVKNLAHPMSTPYVWGGGESRAMAALRRHLRRDVGLERQRVSLTPYWRHATHLDDPVDEEG